jgi:hypothetical protein
MTTRSEGVAGDVSAPRLIVTCNDWGRRGWRVSLYQPATPRDWNAMGRRLSERFCRTEASARKLAKEWARDNGAEMLEG